MKKRLTQARTDAGRRSHAGRCGAGVYNEESRHAETEAQQYNEESLWWSGAGVHARTRIMHAGTHGTHAGAGTGENNIILIYH